MARSRPASTTRTLRFAPLNNNEDAVAGMPVFGGLSGLPAPQLAGIIFDVDGTLTMPQRWMFTKMREALGIDSKTDILHHVACLPEDSGAMELVEAVEREAMMKMEPSKGLLELMGYLENRGIRKGILTRNYEYLTPQVNHLLTHHLPKTLFSPIVTRSFHPPKPSPDGILYIAKQWGLSDARNLIMVGDSMDDMAAGRSAGAATVLLVNDANKELGEHEFTDCVVERLDELIGMLESGFTERARNAEEIREEIQKVGEAMEG
ncbi:HAD-like domain-containing protein [Pyronema domesticum]|nr:HAD-like domain-containing protein [Pyronema domesticum]